MKVKVSFFSLKRIERAISFLKTINEIFLGENCRTNVFQYCQTNGSHTLLPPDILAAITFIYLENSVALLVSFHMRDANLSSI